MVADPRRPPLSIGDTGIVENPLCGRRLPRINVAMMPIFRVRSFNKDNAGFDTKP